MKQANNNEVDLLLRSLARGREEPVSQSASASGDGKRVASDHLDADQLNSYAEGVAPAPARARYMEHLADCDACRRIVVGLTQAAGVVNRYDLPEQQTGFSFWQKLAALFSPPVLLYAVPALVLTAVIGIGWLALRQQRDNQFVAQNEPGLTAPASTPGETGSALNNIPGPPATIQEGTQAGTKPDAAREKENLQGQKTQAGQPSQSLDSLTQLAPGKDAARSADGTETAESRPYALEPKAAAPPPPAPLLDAEKSAELAKERPVKREDQPRDRDEVLRYESDDVHGPNRSRNKTALPANGRNAGGLMTGSGPSSATDKKKAGEVETRTVMGRHFTREGDAWIDTAYDSARATVRVARGSDQFRALVADEPGIRTIAEQLNGVVIVVWKGRAYRIQ